MEGKFPHWYHAADKSGMCCDEMGKKKTYDDCMPHKPPAACCLESFQDRIVCLLGDEVMFSVDARVCGRETFCGTLCYVGCDFIIVNVCIRGKSVSLHVPIDKIRFIAPARGRRLLY